MVSPIIPYLGLAYVLKDDSRGIAFTMTIIQKIDKVSSGDYAITIVSKKYIEGFYV